MSDREKLVATTVVCVFALILVFIMGTAINATPDVSRCAEDVVLVGCGEFEEGRWSYYICGPALDDFIGR